MGTPGRGHKSYLQFGVETTYGTAVAATHKVEVISMKVDPIIGVIRDPSLYDAVARRALYQGGLMYKGNFVIRCNYSGLGVLWKAALGAVATTGVGPYVHVFKESADLPSLTLQMIEGNIPATQYQRVDGAIITSMTIRGTAGQGDDGMVQVEFEVLAKNKLNVASAPTTITNFPALAPVLFHHATVVDNGTGDTSSDIRVRSFEISHRSPFTEDRFYLGATNIDQPLREDFVACQWKITSEFQTIAQFNAAAAFTVGDPELTFTTGATAILNIVSNSANLVEYSNPVENYGIILAQATWEAWYNSSDLTSLMLTTTNSQAAFDTAN